MLCRKTGWIDACVCTCVCSHQAHGRSGGRGQPHLPSNVNTAAFTHSPLVLVYSELEPGGENPEDSGMVVYLKGTRDSEGGFLEEVSLPSRWPVK